MEQSLNLRNTAHTGPSNGGASVSPSRNYSSFWRRLSAYSIDSLVVLLINMSLGMSFRYAGVGSGSANSGGFAWSSSAVGGSIGLMVGIGYYLLFWTKHNGQTLGNRLMAIRVIRDDGKPMDWGTGAIRYVGYIISGIPFGLGFLWMIWDKKKQGWQDKIAKTVVVKTEGKPKMGVAVGILGCSCLAVILALVLFGAGMVALVKSSKKNPQRVQKELSASPIFKEALEVDQGAIDRLVDNTSSKILAYRQGKGLSVWEVDGKLCAYAQRRLEQMSKTEKYDDSKGFYEDLANPNISQAYFTSYSSVGEAVYNIYKFTEADSIVSQWSNYKNSMLDSKKYTNFCIRADESFLILIAAEHI